MYCLASCASWVWDTKIKNRWKLLTQQPDPSLTIHLIIPIELRKEGVKNKGKEKLRVRGRSEQTEI